MSEASIQRIIIDPAANGVILSSGDVRKVFVLDRGERGRSVHDLLREIASTVGNGLDVNIEVRDPEGLGAPIAAKPKKLLTPADVSAEYGWSVKTLEEWRHAGKGPQYTKLGESRRAPIYYRREDVEAFLRSNTIRTTGKV